MFSVYLAGLQVSKGIAEEGTIDFSFHQHPDAFLWHAGYFRSFFLILSVISLFLSRSLLLQSSASFDGHH